MKTNTVILFKSKYTFYDEDKNDIEPGCTLLYPAWPEEIGRWPIRDIEKARLVLANFNCTYTEYPGLSCVEAEEYFLQYCQCDTSGNIIRRDSCDLELAPEKTECFGEYCLMQECHHKMSDLRGEEYTLSYLVYLDSFSSFEEIGKHIEERANASCGRPEYLIFRTQDTDITWDIRSMCLGRIEKQDADPVMIIK